MSKSGQLRFGSVVCVCVCVRVCVFVAVFVFVCVCVCVQSVVRCVRVGVVFVRVEGATWTVPVSSTSSTKGVVNHCFKTDPCL